MRIMLDTNVLISVFIFKSKSLEQLLNTICLQHTLVLSSYIIGELYEVIERKFPGKTELLDVFLARIPYELEHTPHNIPDHNLFTIRDNQDEKVLYGMTYKTKLGDLANYINMRLVKWARRKYLNLKIHKQRAYDWLARVYNANQALFEHWKLFKVC